MENRSILKFKELEKMINSLNESINIVSKNTNYQYEKSFKDSVIQRFEYTIEGTWKFLKYHLLEEFGKDEVFAQAVFKSAYKAKLIDDLEIFISMVKTRNRLSHDYHEEFSEISFDIILNDYIGPINNILDKFIKHYEK